MGQVLPSGGWQSLIGMYWITFINFHKIIFINITEAICCQLVTVYGIDFSTYYYYNLFFLSQSLSTFLTRIPFTQIPFNPAKTLSSFSLCSSVNIFPCPLAVSANEDHILDCCLSFTNIYSAPMARTGSELRYSILKSSVPPTKLLDFKWRLYFGLVSTFHKC